MITWCVAFAFVFYLDVLGLGSIFYLLVSSDDQILYDLSGFDIIYEPGDDVSGSDYPADD